MPIVISKETKKLLGTDNAPLPSTHPDPNVGKTAFTTSGVYAAIPGIIYPRHEGIKYIKSAEGLFKGDYTAGSKPYLLLIFYMDGSLFCGIPVSPEDLGLNNTLPSGSGTLADPYWCSPGTWYSTGPMTATTPKPQLIHALPWKAGKVTVTMSIESNDPNGNWIAYGFDIVSLSTGVRLAFREPAVGSSGQTSTTFYYDPQFTGDILVVKPTVMFSKYRTAGSTRYMFGCPV